MPDRDRLVYLFGENALGELEDADFDDGSTIAELVERYLPLPEDQEVQGARTAIRTIAVTQILRDDPPATWEAAVRLRGAGLERDQVLSQLAMAVSVHLMAAVESEERPDPDGLVRFLDALPLPSPREVAEALVSVARSEPGIEAREHVAQTVALLGGPDSQPIIEPLADRVLDHLVGGPLHWLAGDETVVFHDTIAGRTFTHRFNEPEQELQFLSVAVDLPAFGRFGTVRLPDGQEVDQFSVERGHLAWRGPDGWLDRFRPGDLLAVTATFDPVTGDDEVEATITLDRVVDEPPVTEALVSAVRAAYDAEHHDHELPVATEDIVVRLCHEQPDLFTSPLPPLSDCLDAAGLDRSGSDVAHDQTVWRRALAHRRLHRVMDLVPERQWRLVLGQAVEVLADPEADIDDVRASLADCAEPEALDVLADVLIPELLAPEDEFERGSADAPGHVFELVGRAVAVARRPREVATAAYLACVLNERCGRPLVAAEHLARAADAQPRLGPIVERMGWYCFDRGDARGAMRWWRELDRLPESASTIQPFLAPAAGSAKVGRNDPCWCGSGRKLKQCHQAMNALPPLPDRVAWLARKAVLWVEHASGWPRQLVVDLALGWATGDAETSADDLRESEVEELKDELAQAFQDPIVFDAALTEGGLFRHFLRERGELLPDDEQLLAASWQTVERSVHEVLSVERGAGLTVRNLATGDVADVRERSLSRALEEGDRFCARIVPDGVGWQILGGVFPVRTGHEETVLDLCAEGDPAALCAWAGDVARPPRIIRTPGLADRMFDREAIESALADLGDADEATVLARLNEEVVRQAQARWLDDRIPALGGLTPREAAADPTRREQLERLLDEFEAMDERLREVAARTEGLAGGPVTYDVAELRRELGLI